MHPDRRSRRRLLGGLLSSLFGWPWLRRATAGQEKGTHLECH
jgi:hypothetical protein